MKKIIIAILICFNSVLTTHAQWVGTTANSTIYGRFDATYPTNGLGYFSLKTNNTDHQNGGLTMQYLNNGNLTDGLILNSNGEVISNGSFYGRFDGSFPTIGKGYFALKTNNVNEHSGGLTIQYLDQGNLNDGLSINYQGNVGIGTIETGSHKLAVEGSIGAREIKVEASGWSDFVFENDYELQTLEEVEEHIVENGHLPEIPSEAEVTENGINLGEMNAKLLQKIEELTLYMIDMNKQMQQLKSENQVLKEEISTLKSN